MFEENSNLNTERRQEIPISYRTVRGLAYWAGFVGIWFIIGAILAFIGAASILFLAGDYAFFDMEGMEFYGFSVEMIAGAAVAVIAGVIALVMGAKLRGTKRSLEDFIASGKASVMEAALSNAKSFFKIQGVMIILGLVFAVVTIVFSALTTHFFSLG